LSREQLELFICAGTVANAAVGLATVTELLGNTHPLVALISDPRQGTTIDPGPELRAWMEGLPAQNPIARATFYFATQLLNLEDRPESPWNPDLEPERIPMLTLRSMTGGE